MSQEPVKPDEAPETVAMEQPALTPGKGTRIGTLIVLTLIVGSLVWYFAADRLTPPIHLKPGCRLLWCRWLQKYLEQC